jgi:hypothetical protein
MNAERLHSVVATIREELNTNAVEQRFAQTIQSLQNLVSNPHPQHQQNWANALLALRASLATNPSDGFSPSYRQITDEIGATKFIGSGLLASVEAIVGRNQITLPTALQELQAVHHNLKLLNDAVNQADVSFNAFKIGSEVVAPGEAEIGILIPRAGVGNDLKQFAAELKEWTQILNTFSEVATGHPDVLEIKTISSSDLLVFLKGGVRYSACVAKAVSGIVALYKTLLEIRKCQNGLKQQNVPEDSLRGIDSYANDLMDKGTTDLSVKIVTEFYKNKDAGRKNELITMTKISLNKMANRIDRGFNVEVRVEAIVEGEESTPGNAEAKADVEAILGAASEMKYIKQNGEPILHLSEAPEKTKK